jgi:hypothetical protein
VPSEIWRANAREEDAREENRMNRLAAMTAPAWAFGPDTVYSGAIEGVVRYVNSGQQLIVLADGTELSVASPAQLQQVQPGSAVRLAFVQDYGRKTVERIELIAR